MKQDKVRTQLWKVSKELENALKDASGDVESILKGYESNISTTETAVIALREFKQTVSATSIKSLDGFLNLYLFIITFQLDISVVLHRFFLSKLDYELVYFGKSSALLTYEFINSIDSAFHEFAKTAPAILQPEIQTMKKELKKIRKFKKDNPQLKQIRNVIAAHRHLDAFEYLRMSLEMESYKFIKPILGLLPIITEMSLIAVSCLKKIDEVVAKVLTKDKK